MPQKFCEFPPSRSLLPVKTYGLNIINVLHTAFTLVDPKSVKRHWWLNCIFYAFGIYECKSCTSNINDIDTRSLSLKTNSKFSSQNNGEVYLSNMFRLLMEQFGWKGLSSELLQDDPRYWRIRQQLPSMWLLFLIHSNIGHWNWIKAPLMTSQVIWKPIYPTEAPFHKHFTRSFYASRSQKHQKTDGLTIFLCFWDLCM